MADAKPAQPRDRVPLYIAGVVTLILSILYLGQIIDAGAFHGANRKWTDQLFRWRGMETGDPRLSVVTIDDESIKYIGQFPWPRSTYVRLFDKLFQKGVKVIGVDVNMPDPSTPREDAALVVAARRWGKKVVFVANIDPTKLHENVFVYPFPALARVAKSIGAVDQLDIDNDGAVRRTFLMIGTRRDSVLDWPKDPQRVPALGIKVLSVFEGKSPDEYVKHRNLLTFNMRGQQRTIAGTIKDKDGVEQDIIRDEYGIRRIPAHKVLGGTLQEEELQALNGGIVLLGSTAVGAYDHFPTAFTKLAPGVEVHANVIDNILNDRELHNVPLWGTLLLIPLFAGVGAFALALGPLAGTTLVLLFLLVWVIASYQAFLRLWVLDFWEPALAVASTFAYLMVRKTRMEGAEKKFIKQTFGQFVAPEVVDDLVQDPSKVKLGGEKREMTVFFLDIAHFTTISEKMEPEALILFLNRYLSALSQVIHDHKGVVDKYIGDCIMAFWNAPINQPDHRAQACISAVECMETLEELNKNLDPNLPERPAIRIGLNSGDMTVGLTGSKQKLQYTVIGDEVNLASRLEGANKFFGSNIMVSEECYVGAKDVIEARILGSVRVVGKSIPILVYELLGKKGKLSPEWQKAFPHYQKGVDLFQKGDFAGAKEAFTEVLKVFPKDNPTKVYMRLVDDYLVIPPGEGMDWKVFNLTAK